MEKISRAFRRVFVLIFLSVVITSLSSGNSSDKEFTIKKIANFNNPNSITCVGKYLYVTDTNNHSIRKIDKTTGYVTTFAGMSESHGIADGIGMRAKFNNPSGITSDGHNLYIADSSNHTIRKIFIKTGKVTTIAGSPGNAGSKDGKGKSALFNYPYGITFAENNLYVTDFENSTIRKIEIKTGIVSTIAGNPGTEISKDGIGQSAFFHHPYGIAFNQNNLYITENHTIRKMDLSTGAVTTIAGRPGENGFSEKNGSNALFRYPDGICCDGKNIYISDSYNFIIRKIAIDDDMITTVAGTPGESGDLDGDNQSALFFKPNGIVADGEDIFVVDSKNHCIKRISINTKTVTTLTGTKCGSEDGIGGVGHLDHPSGLAFNGEYLYVADAYNNKVRKVDIFSGSISTINTDIKSTRLIDIASDGANFYVSDFSSSMISRIDISTGRTTTIAGGKKGYNEGAGSTARFNNPMGITIFKNFIYVVDHSNNVIRRIEISTGTVTTIAGKPGTDGTRDGISDLARFYKPCCITHDGDYLYITDSGNNTIRKVEISTGMVSTIAGRAGVSGFSDGKGPEALFYEPKGITYKNGCLYVSDYNNHVIRRIVISTGEVTTIAGKPGEHGGNDGKGSTSRFYFPIGITSDSKNLYVTDEYGCTVRKIEIETFDVSTLAGEFNVKGNEDTRNASTK